MHRLRILHVSDLHAAAASDWRREKVLGQAWLRNLDALLEDGRPVHLVSFTGDLANKGSGLEYGPGAEFLLATLEHLKVPPDRLFLVPGNHDVDRTVAKPVWDKFRTEIDSPDAEGLSRWMAGAKPLRGFDEADREAILTRQAAYRQCLANVLGRADLLPDRSPHRRLGYRVDVPGLGLPFPVHVIGLDSAWLSGDDHDAGKLRLTDDQVMLLASDSGKPLPGLRLALVHHPLADLADAASATRLLAGHVDLVLRGHLHHEEVSLWADPDRTPRQVAAGCLYEPNEFRYPNACHLIDLSLGPEGRPVELEFHFRAWGPREFWHDNDGLYEGTRAGRLTVSIGPGPTPPPDWVPRAKRLFVGREPELAKLCQALPEAAATPGPVAIVSLQGMPGVGKSYLAARFVALYGSRFPGGVVSMVLAPDDRRDAAGLVRDLCDRLRLAAAGPDHARQVLGERLRLARALLLVENVDGEPQARAVAELVRGIGPVWAMLTGRWHGLGREAGWPQVVVRPLDEPHALEQLALEFRPARGPGEAAEFCRLVKTLGLLPLAIHLAAGHLGAGRSVAGFLEMLRRKGLKVGPADPADPLAVDRARSVISTTFGLSLALLRSALKGKSRRLLAAFRALGHAPLSGVGRSLGAAIAGLEELEFEELTVQARRLSLLEYEPPAEGCPERYRVHPLLAELLRPKIDRPAVIGRMTEWFVARLPKPSGEELSREGLFWNAIHQEHNALTEWLGEVPPADLRRVERAGSHFAFLCGPFLAWAGLCRRGLDHTRQPAERSDFLWTLGKVLLRAADVEGARAAAEEKFQIDRDRGDERDAALARGLIADVLQARGELDEALRIRREEVLPVYERLGDVRERAVTMGKIADVLRARGELDEALRIRREEQLPVYERLGDVRARAVTMGKIADVLQARGEFDEALRIRREDELPVYERLGDVHSRAVTMGQIADILQDRGELDEALRIRREEVLPVYERLGDMLSRSRCRWWIAHILLKRGKAGDREEAVGLLRSALEDARKMGIPEAKRIAEVLAGLGEA